MSRRFKITFTREPQSEIGNHIEQWRYNNGVVSVAVNATNENEALAKARLLVSPSLRYYSVDGD